jgi:hypothetical protein
MKIGVGRPTHGTPTDAEQLADALLGAVGPGQQRARRLRYLPAWDHDLCRTGVSVYVRAVLGFLRTRARRAGIANGRRGAVAIIQRFGGALSLKVHIHALVIDGVFTDNGAGLRFHPASRLTRDDVGEGGGRIRAADRAAAGAARYCAVAVEARVAKKSSAGSNGSTVVPSEHALAALFVVRKRIFTFRPVD